ncbi:MAG: NADH:ubiquinone reductase (Na(+)-transporting) subunit B [Bacteroidales bacterium]|nr:NADH:ubiquinone reductase (Na(+)-transporting) subunit B [Bacteroidales bacterium]
MNKIFEKGGKLSWLHSTVDAFETFLAVPPTVSSKGSHVRDAVDLKRIIIIALIAAIPAALFGMWNVGYQHGLAIGDTRLNIIGNWWFGFLKVLPLYIVAYAVGLFIEFGTAQIRGEEVNEGFLMTGFLIPLIIPVTTPLWMVGLATAFSVIFCKEVFGGTGMNIWNPALVARAFLFFSYPKQMSGSECWIAMGKGETMLDACTGATPLALDGASAQYGTGFWDLFIGTVPGSVGETSVICILLGAAILIWTGVGSWKIMAGSVAGALLVGWIGNIGGATTIPAWEQLLLGGFAFGTVFMATDPVTSCQTECGKWIYGLLIGMLCVTVRLFNPGYAEGMMLAILLCNTFAPLIDHCVTGIHISRRNKKLNAA